jgi:hypothetical protein
MAIQRAWALGACAWLGLVAGSAAAADKEAVVPLHLSRYVGQQVELAGKKSRIPWQHLVGQVEGKQAEHFDPEDGGNQLVVHVAGGLPSEEPCVLWGRVLEVRGGSKRPPRPGDKPSKADDSYVEYALDVDRVVWIPKAEELPGLLAKLADPALGQEVKRAAEERLVAAGLAAVPLLLERRLEGLLYRIVLPRNHRSPDQAALEPSSAGRDGGALRVKDWQAFFARRQGQSLAEIREALKPAIDRWYQTKGEEQVVE